MKKIFTLIFSLGLLSAAFAQGGNRQQDYKRDNNYGKHSYSYQDDHKKRDNDKSYQTAPYSNTDKWKYQSDSRRNDNRYGNDRDRQGRYGDNDYRNKTQHDDVVCTDNTPRPDLRNPRPVGNPLIQLGLQIVLGLGKH